MFFAFALGYWYQYIIVKVLKVSVNKIFYITAGFLVCSIIMMIATPFDISWNKHTP